VGVVHSWRLHEARDLLRQIQEIDPHFRDVRQMLNEVEEELKHDAERKSALFFKKIFWIILAFLPFIFFISFFLFKIFSAPSQTSFYSEYIKTISDEVKYKQKDILPINIKEKMNDDTRKSRIVFPDEVIKIAPVGEYIVENSSSYENILHKFVSMEVQGDKVIIDTVTHLMWQHSGSPDTMKWQQARDNFIMNLNKTSYAGYSDWRLPTIAELAMLLERTPKHGDLYIDQLFDIRQRWCWSVDRGRGYMAWRVKFHTGTAAELSIDGDSYVRAVRDHRTPE
jgi:hypothetical protein